MHECMVRLCILLNSLLYICKSELRKSQSGIKGFFFATAPPGHSRPLTLAVSGRVNMHAIEPASMLQQQPRAAASHAPRTRAGPRSSVQFAWM